MDKYPFSKDAGECKLFWDVRKGLIPIVGGAREAGTSMLIEDVACPVVRPLPVHPTLLPGGRWLRCSPTRCGLVEAERNGLWAAWESAPP